VLCCAVLCCAVLCCAVLCCAVLCCAVLCWRCAGLCCAGAVLGWRCAVLYRAALYFDVGASTFNDGPGGPSQSYFLSQMRAQCLRVDGVFAWEAKTEDPANVWAQVGGCVRPARRCHCMFALPSQSVFHDSLARAVMQVPGSLRPVYRWYNIFASPDPTSPDNPLNHVRAVATEADYVMLKVGLRLVFSPTYLWLQHSSSSSTTACDALHCTPSPPLPLLWCAPGQIDIDNNEVEEALVRQLLADPSLLALVDEFYWEHHVNFAPMSELWNTQGSSQRMSHSLALFSQLRRAGVRAHSWT
jgi:hypothetical protein